MEGLGVKDTLLAPLFGLLGWALCGAKMFIGVSLMDLQTPLIVHAIRVPLIFFLITGFYFRRYHFTSPLGTAVLFPLIVIFTDFFLVALAIKRSLEMFRNALGTWIPFALIFASTYLTGLISKKGMKQSSAA
jgi:hypothetical protein